MTWAAAGRGVLDRGPRILGALLCALTFSDSPACVAGPPYVTDDPVPTDYRHWEIYTGFQYDNEGLGSANAGVPFSEFNYGAMPNVQVSLSLLATQDANPFGHGSTEFGVKTRLVQESDRTPQISFYPSIETPAMPGRHAVTFLPLWMQKSAGPWTLFGGGGVYLNSGPGERNYTFLGGALQRSISPGIDVGGEVYRQGADGRDGRETTAANLGTTIQVGAYHAFLLSFGRALHGDTTFSGYASYEFALGKESSR